jgi:hypothetical protein
MQVVSDGHTRSKVGLMVKIGADKPRTCLLYVNLKTLYLLFLQQPSPTLGERRYKTAILLVLYACETCVSVTSKKGDKSKVSETKKC